MNPVQTSTQEACTYHQLDGEIHHYTFNEATRQALGQHFEHYTRLIRQAPLNQPFRVVLDFRPAGFPPITYAFQKARQVYREVPKQPPLRFAILNNPGVLTSVVQGMFNLMIVRNTTRFFPADQFDQAINWLRRGD